MRDSFDPKQLIGAPRARLLVVATLAIGVLGAGCGAGSGSPPAATAGGASASASTVAAGPGSTGTDPNLTTGGGATNSQPHTPAGMDPTALAFSRCMRANGVPNFPDPDPGAGFRFSETGLDRSSPAFRAAQAKCQTLLPAGGPPRPGTQTHPSAQTLAKLVEIAQCMRRHGVPDFPDPRSSVPANPFPSGTGVITDYDGAILLFPSTLNMQSPAYTQAVAACGILAGKLGRGPH